MNPHLESKFRRIEKMSVFLRAFCTALLVVVAAATAMAVAAICLSRGSTNLTFFSQSIAVADLTARSRLILGAVMVFTGAVMIKSLVHLRRLLGNYSRREIFTAGSAGEIRQFGIGCMLWGGVKILWAFLPVILQTSPTRTVAITIDTIAIGGVIVVISWIAEMAASLREENDLTI